MGTDIHAFVEIDEGTEPEPFGSDGQIRPFNTGEFDLWRNYDLFDALGNGRSSATLARRHALFPPRGLPKAVSRAVFDRYHLDWVETPADARPWRGPVDVPPVAAITRAAIDRPDEPSRPQPFPDVLECNAEGIGVVRPLRVANPHWHDASWLYLDEVYRALDHFEIRVTSLDVAAQVMIQAMDRFDRALGPRQSRLVFWFDS